MKINSNVRNKDGDMKLEYDITCLFKSIDRLTLFKNRLENNDLKLSATEAADLNMLLTELDITSAIVKKIVLAIESSPVISSQYDHDRCNNSNASKTEKVKMNIAKNEESLILPSFSASSLQGFVSLLATPPGTSSCGSSTAYWSSGKTSEVVINVSSNKSVSKAIGNHVTSA